MRRVKEESEKVSLKLNIKKNQDATSDSITSWQTEWEMVEAVTNVLFLGSKITVNGDCSHEIRKCLRLGRKALTNLDSVLKSKCYFTDKDSSSHSYGSSVVMYGCESWTIKKAEHQRISGF